MILSLPSGRSGPRSWRGVSLLFALLGVLLGAAQPRAPSATPLTEGFRKEREIQGGKVHVYSVELRTGQFLRVSVQEQAVDLIVRLTDTSGKVVTGVDGLPTGEANEDLAFVATDGGGYELLISPARSKTSGRYLLGVEALGEPQGVDRLLSGAVRATWDGFHAPKLSPEDRLRTFEQALTLWQQIGNSRKAAEVLYCLGYVKKEMLFAYDQAAVDFQRSASLWGQQPGRASKTMQTNLLTEAGRSLSKAERRAESRALHQQALDLAVELKDPGFQAANLNILGQFDVDDGELQRGLERLNEALVLARQAGDRKTEAVILNNLALAYDQLSEVQKALDSNEQALELARRGEDQEAEMIFLNNLGVAYRSLGNWEKAVDCYRRAAELSKKDKTRRGMFLTNLAVAYQHLGQLKDARSTFDQALELGRQTLSRPTQLFAHGNLALLLLQSKQPAEAVAQAREALGSAKSLEEENFSRLVLGRALRAFGDSTGAQAELASALALAHKRGARLAEAEINLVLAEMARDGGDLASALSHIKSAINLIEARRGRVIDPELRTSFLASKQDYYEFEVGTLMALHRLRPTSGFAAEALQVSEQARARGLLEILNEAGADIRQGADPVLLERERKLRGEVNARDLKWRELLAKENPDRRLVAEAERQLEQAIEAHQKVQVELREKNPAYAALTQPQPVDVKEIQDQLLDGKALLLEYSLGNDKSFLWAVSPASMQRFELPGRERIEKVAREYYDLITVQSHRRAGEPIPAFKTRIAAADVAAEKAARDLAQMILQPARKLLVDQPLLIVADGALQYIPFAALPVSATGAPLASRHQILNLPSASVLAVIRRELHGRSPAPKRLAILADPVVQRDDKRLLSGLHKTRRVRSSHASSPQRRGAPDEKREANIDLTRFGRLPASHNEAETITALLRPAEVFRAEGFAASRAVVTSGRLGSYRNVHFATHGWLDSDHPQLSGLVLSLYNERGELQRDGFLRLNDVYNLRLNADLVVLSACQTALGKEIRGEGLVGLTRGFMYAGAARVLASLWSVEDRSTAELMGSFYRGMLREGLTPAEALRRAQLEIARKPAWKSPYFWAGFSLQGEWR